MTKHAHRGLLLGALWASLLVLASNASAQTSQEEYKRVTDEAVEEYGLGHWDEAFALFSKAHELEPSARTYWGMSITAFEARRYPEAVRFARSACNDRRKPLTSAQRTQAESILTRAEEFVVRVHFAITPNEAHIEIDGGGVDGRGELLVAAGPHQVVINAPGYQEAVRSVQWSAGTSHELKLALVPEPVSQRVEPTVLTPNEAAPRKSSMVRKVSKWLAVSLGVGALGALGAGIEMRNDAATHWNDSHLCPPPKAQSCAEQRTRANHLRAFNIGAGAAAAAFAVLATSLFIVDRERPSPVARALAVCQPGLGTLDCHVQF